MKTDQKTLTLAVKKALGTLNNVLAMIEDDAYCADIGQQINTAIGLLRSANTQLLKDHLACCGAKAMKSGDNNEIRDFVDEFARVWDMSVRK